MKTMFQTIARHLRAGEDLVLVTVVASSGSTPRGAGSRMLLNRGGRICGTIGGGAVEFRSEQLAQEVLQSRQSCEQSFLLTKNDVQDLGMICGGDVQVFFHFLAAGDAAVLSLAEEAETLFAEGHDLWLVSELSAGGSLGLFSRERGFVGISAPEALRDAMRRRPVREEIEGRDFYVEQIQSSGRVLVFGCGHVAQALVPVLSKVGFRCVAMDDRPEFARADLFPDAADVRLIDFTNVAASVTITPEDYICVMTRGHAFDAVVQAQAMQSSACYIGVIGSRKKIAGVKARLKEEYGFSDADFERVTSPIGLAIRAETPEEIAISIAAQLIALRAERSGRR